MLTINVNKKFLPFRDDFLIITIVITMHRETFMVSALPLNESQIARAAEKMIAAYGDEALSNADV